MQIKILGQIYSYIRAVNPPTNVEILWYDMSTSLLKFYYKGSWIPIATTNLGLISLTGIDTPDYLGNKIDSTLQVISNVLGVTNPVLYGINLLTTTDGSNVAQISNKYDVLEFNGGASDIVCVDIKLSSVALPNGFSMKIVNLSATNNVNLQWSSSTQNGFNGNFGSTFVQKGSNVTIGSPLNYHNIKPYEGAYVTKYADNRWFINEVWEVKNTAYNKNFGNVAGTVPVIGANLAVSSQLYTDANGFLTT